MTNPSLPDVVVELMVRGALAEDLGRGGDITSNAVIPAEAKAHAAMVARQDGIICGLEIAEAAFRLVDATLRIRRLKRDGDTVSPGDTVMEVEGSARAVLAGERVALNFVGHLSGIATLTSQMVKATGNHKARICDTRKTTPGLRALEKYAVRVGGGLNHRAGLDGAILIKDNHIAIAGGVVPALRRAKENAGHTVKIEIEVDTIDQLKEVMEEGADVVMLDNMSLSDMAMAVLIVNGRALVEASGGVTLGRVGQIAATGVDLISSGSLTHSAPNFDVGLDFKAA